MPSLTLTHHNHDQVVALLNKKSGHESWFVACLCAAWCDTCCEYRARFDQLAARFPDLAFIWIDIEDQAEVVGDLDIDNFPTLLVQYGDIVSFMGPVLPDLQLAERLLQAQFEQNQTALLAQANLNDEHREWQINCNLRQLLANR
jgi:thioredoxin 1